VLAQVGRDAVDLGGLDPRPGDSQARLAAKKRVAATVRELSSQRPAADIEDHGDLPYAMSPDYEYAVRKPGLVDLVEIDPVPGERYLLCSDGLFGVVSDEQIAAIMSDRRARLEEICVRLIDAANDAGGPDNITAMLLQADAP